ncbi:hypothetical protein [Candidatus Hecatella orcuttiae]|nr:hypothetical protein [Candidatus Hecatella orcuttiae]
MDDEICIGGKGWSERLRAKGCAAACTRGLETVRYAAGFFYSSTPLEA